MPAVMPGQGMGLVMLHVGTGQLHGLWAAQGLTPSADSKAGLLRLYTTCSPSLPRHTPINHPTHRAPRLSKKG